jgi:hypothetical protein
MVASEEEIKRFLKLFFEKRKIWQILFRDDRGKNTSTLSQLEISPNQRIAVIDKLEFTDYCEGPLLEKLNGGADMWVFGKVVKAKEIYIKISLGIEALSVICISFHIAEHPLTYPYKMKKT